MPTLGHSLARAPALAPKAWFLLRVRSETQPVHELSLMEDLVTAVTSEVGGARVHVVRLVVGQRAGASPHALRFCFDICVCGTALEGAALDIVETDGDELRLQEVEVGC